MARQLMAAVLLVGSVTVGGLAAQDLGDISIAIKQGKLTEARTKLQGIVENQPDSVPAQMLLAECQLKLGELDKAVAAYRRVLKLSPSHQSAQRTLDGLLGRHTSIEQVLSSSQELIKISAFETARKILTATLARPLPLAQRDQVELQLASCELWLNQPSRDLSLAYRAKDKTIRSRARIVAALGLMAKKPQQARELLVSAGQVAEPWAGRVRFARFFTEFTPQSDHLAFSMALPKSASSIPESKFRRQSLDDAYERLSRVAHLEAGRGNHQRAFKIAWSMVSSGKVPTTEQVLKPLAVQGGWVESTDRKLWLKVADLLSKLALLSGKDEGDSSFVPFWAAAEMLRGKRDLDPFSAILARAKDLSTLESPIDANRHAKGTSLGVSDEIRLELIRRLTGLAASDKQRAEVIGLVSHFLTRYRQAGDIEAGIKYFIAQDGPVPSLAEPFAARLFGPSRRDLLVKIADQAQIAGAAQFAKNAAKQISTVNSTLNEFDKMVLAFIGRVLTEDKQHKTAQKVADAVFKRYLDARKWEAAQSGLTLLFAGRPEEADWARLRLLVRQAQTDEDRLVTIDRRLPGQLPKLLVEALKAAEARVRTANHRGNRNAAISLGSSLVTRYSRFGRHDLARQVVATLQGAGPEQALADWSLWMRIGLLDVEATRALHAAAAKRIDDRGGLPLHPQHAAELGLLDELITKHPDSPYRAAALGRVLQISTTYEAHRAFDTATSLLEAFAKSHPTLLTQEQLRWHVVVISLSKSRHEFARRKDTATAPSELSASFSVALTRLADYLKAYPSGNYANLAERELLAIAVGYGKAGGWSVVRTILDRVAAAIPNRKEPQRLELLRAISYLGELDRPHALTMFAAPKPKRRASSGSGNRPNPMAGAPSQAGGLAAGGMLAGGGGGMGGGMGLSSRGQTGGFPFGNEEERAAGARAEGGNQSGQATPGGFDADLPLGTARPSSASLALVQQARRRQLRQIAMMKDQNSPAKSKAKKSPQGQQAAGPVSLPSGSVLSEAEIQRQSKAADQAFAILIKLLGNDQPEAGIVVAQARAEMYWLFGFFEAQARPQQAIGLIERFLKDRPDDSAQVELSYRVITNQLAWAAKFDRAEKADLAWMATRHTRFDKARQSLQQFIAKYQPLIAKKSWVNRARMMISESFVQESSLAARVSPVRAGGLLVAAAESLFKLASNNPQHPNVKEFPRRLTGMAQQLGGMGQRDQAVYVLAQLPIHFPTDPTSAAAILLIAQLHAQQLTNPVRAVETYLEYLSIKGDNNSIRTAIYAIAQQLQSRQRYIEAIHVYSVFVDSFPTDARAPQALLAIGGMHQQNEVWKDAVASYQRVLDEFPAAKMLPQVKLAIAECRINLSEWLKARRQYEQFLREHPKDRNAALARVRVEVLKNLDRYEQLLADEKIGRNKDDAQLQIAKIVLSQLQNPVKAVAEFRKVVRNFPKSDVADDAQIEIGKTLLGLNRLDAAREALLAVPRDYPNSPVADDALYLIGQSYEQQAVRLASVTAATARKEAFTRNQKGAYKSFNDTVAEEVQRQQVRRGQLKRAGKSKELALDEASASLRQNFLVQGSLRNRARGAALKAETESAMQVASRQDRINEAYRDAVRQYVRAASDYPLGDKTDRSLLRIAEIFENQLKDRSQAMETYQKIVRLFPGTPVAEDAAWKVALFHEEEGKHAAAVASFREFIRNYPGSSRVAEAQFALAESLEQLDKWVEAMDAYEVFRQKFSKHTKARLAAEQINWIKTYRK